MPPIGFDQIPADARVPFAYVEFNSAGAQQGAGVQPYKSLLIGHKIAAGSAAEGATVALASERDSEVAFGTGSLLHLMAQAWFPLNRSSTLHAIALAAPGAAAAQETTLTFTGAATAAGTVAVYIGDRRIAVPVASGADAATIAAAVDTAADGHADAGFTAAVAGGVVTLEAVGTGVYGTEIPIQHSLGADEALPAGVALAIASATAGSGEADLATLWAAIGDEQYNVIVTPWTSAAALTSIETELASRWGPTRPVDGTAYGAARGTTAQVTAVANNRNSPHVVVMDAATSPSPPFKWAAALGATVALHAPIDPARPFQTLPLTGISAPGLNARRTYTENNNFLKAGVATHEVDAGGVVRIQRLITEYRKSPAGVDDTAYLDVNSVLTLSYLRWDWRAYLQRKYPRHKLGDDGKRYRQGQPVMTPSLGRAEALAKFREWEELGLVEAPEQFKRDLIVERDPRDPNRLNWLIAPDLINQLRITGTQIAFLV